MIKVKTNNLVFDERDPRCTIRFAQSQGKHYAFVTALDFCMAHAPLPRPHKARYWGEFSPDEAEASIKRILEYGGKWPKLTNS